MKPKVSVIVPVYNTDTYLPRCLDSLCRQSLQDIEIILVDDASPDRCGEICDDYAAKDTRFKVIHHSENKGRSVTRNMGIANASGDYLMFVDCDDWVHEDFCKLPYECAVRYQADLTMFGYQTVDSLQVSEKGVVSVSAGNKTRDEAIELTFNAYGVVVWNKLYRKSLFNGTLFPEGITYEDSATTYKLIWKAAKVYCIDKVLYYYYQHPDSFTAKPQSLMEIQDAFAVYWKQCNDLASWGYSSVNMDYFRFYVAFNYCMKKSMDVEDEYYIEAAHFLNSLTKIPKAISWKRRLLYSIFRFSPKLFDFICMLWGKQVS